MKRKTLAIFSVVTLSLTVALPVLAAAPIAGVVVEGESVPGIALGYTRLQVEDAYGDPLWCQSSVNPDDQGYCSFPVDGGGQVNIIYRGADGGDPSNSPNDVVYHISWSQQVSGWTTSAGINTTLALENPQAVIDAYPDALVTYTQYGSIYSLVDHEQGFEVIWAYDFYTGRTNVNMAVFFQRTPPPTQEKLTRVTEINLTFIKERGQRQVSALVRVQDDLNLATSGATVFATWVFPDGSTQVVDVITSNAGYAYFEASNTSRGTYTLTIDDVVLDGYRFDRNDGVLSASIIAK